MPDLVALYRFRFRESEREKKMQIWKTLCERYFQRLIGDDRVVADLACGYGEFINNIKAAKKYGIDLNPDAPKFLQPDVQFCACRADSIDAIASDSVDVVFTSNFLEHLKTKEECDAVLAEVRRILKPGRPVRHHGSEYPLSGRGVLGFLRPLSATVAPFARGGVGTGRLRYRERHAAVSALHHALFSAAASGADCALSQSCRSPGASWESSFSSLGKNLPLRAPDRTPPQPPLRAEGWRGRAARTRQDRRATAHGD